MRKFVVMSLFAVAAVMFAGNFASAAVLGGGNDNGHGGGHGGGYNDGHDNNGKDSNKYCIYMKNKDHYYGMACWVYEQSYDYYPSTLGHLRSECIYIDPYATGHTDKMKKGYYEVCVFCAHDLYGPSYHQIDHYFYDHYTVDCISVHLDYGDVYLCCDKYGIWYEGDGGYGGGYGGHGGGF